MLLDRYPGRKGAQGLSKLTHSRINSFAPRCPSEMLCTSGGVLCAQCSRGPGSRCPHTSRPYDSCSRRHGLEEAINLTAKKFQGAQIAAPSHFRADAETLAEGVAAATWASYKCVCHARELTLRLRSLPARRTVNRRPYLGRFSGGSQSGPIAAIPTYRLAHAGD